MSYDVQKTSRLRDVQLLGQTIKLKINSLDEKVASLEDVGSQANVIESVKVNGEILAIDENKAVNVVVPTKTSDITNDSTYQTAEEVTATVEAAISKSGHASFVKVDSVPAVEDAVDNILYLVMNDETGHYDIYAKVGDEVVLIDDTTVDLSDYVTKETGKGLSTNDYTTAEKEKLSQISEGSTKTAASATNGNIIIDGTETKVYEHPAHTAHASGLWKVTVDALGHVSDVASVTTDDITPLIPYTTDDETSEMISEIFG